MRGVRSGRHSAALVAALVGAAGAWCTDARAQADAGAPAPSSTAATEAADAGAPPPVTLPSSETQHWPELYAAARQALLDGEWTKAADSLERLVDSAPTPEDARAAKELASLARYWQKRDLVFVERQALGESTAFAKAVDRRSTDEIVTLYGTAAAYGAGIALSTAALLDGNSAIAYVIPAVIGTGIGIGGVALADTFGRIRYGQAQSIASGVFLGLGEGLLFGGAHASLSGYTPWDWKVYVGIGMATTTLGGALGGIVASVVPMTPGRASWVSSMGLWTGGLVACVTGAIAADSWNNGGGVLLAGLVGYNTGILGGAFTAGLVSPSVSRVRVLDLGGIVGGASVGGIYAAIVSAGNGTVDANAMLGLTGLGIAAGLTTSWLLTMGMAPDRPIEPGETKPKAALDVHPILYPMPGGASAGLAGTF